MLNEGLGSRVRNASFCLHEPCSPAWVEVTGGTVSNHEGVDKSKFRRKHNVPLKCEGMHKKIIKGGRIKASGSDNRVLEEEGSCTPKGRNVGTGRR